MKVKRVLLLIVITSFLFQGARQPDLPVQYQIKRIVIDAGHGGHDPGAVGKTAKEKDITLSLALKLGKLIQSNYKDVEVIYTRKTDVFVELYKRAKIANERKADLFVSIHINASKSPTPYGTETFVMGLTKSDENLAVAKKENASVLLEDNYSANYDGFDPNSPEGNIIFSLYQNTYLEQSLNLAAKIQKQFREKANRFDRGVKQAGFLVLWKTTMPSVLIEAGFISNPSEEAYLASESGQNAIASSIFRAFREFKQQYEGVSQPALVEDTNNISTEEYIPIPEINPSTNTPKKDSLSPSPISSNEPEVYFSVQFATSAKLKPYNSPDFKGIKGVFSYYHGGMYKYLVGKEQSLMAAMDLLADVQAKGFKDAFVVAFNKGERISPKQAVELINK